MMNTNHENYRQAIHRRPHIFGFGTINIRRSLWARLAIASLARFYESVFGRPFMKSGAHIAFAICACSVTIAAGATAQISDQILIDGQTELLFTEPLQDGMRANPKLQKNLMSHISEKNRCSASWRGYAATWEIRSNNLYLVNVQVDPCSEVKKMIPLVELFPGATGPVKATWFSGTLTVPQGKQIEYVHMGYGSRYERYLFLDIDKGKVTRSTLTSGSPKLGTPAK